MVLLRAKTTRPPRRWWALGAVVAVVMLCLLVMRGDHKSAVTSDAALNENGQSLLHRDSLAVQAARLDRQYLSRSTFKTGSSTARVDDERYADLTTTIVTGRLANESERVRWIHEQLPHVQNKVVYVVDDASSPLPHLEANHGREAAVYLSYIVDNYENLSDITYFWHNDDQVWHNNLMLGHSSIETINRMDRGNIMTRGYVPSRCDSWPGCPVWIRFNPSRAEHSLDPHRLESLFNRKLFSTLFPETTDFPPYFAGTCCSQFAVSRDAILSRPLNSYRRLLDWAKTYENDEDSGRVFEFSWPFIFTGKGTMCPSMEECYCRTYNICLAPSDADELVLWNDLRTRREEIKWQVNFVDGALELRQQQLEAEGASQAAVVAIEDLFQPEVERLSDELDELSNKTWLLREGIIRKWHLPPPPEGW